MTTHRPHQEPARTRAIPRHLGVPPPRPPRDAQPVRNEVEIDEARERVGEDPVALGLEGPDGIDELGEELGESYVENVTGADDAATEHRSEDDPEDVSAAVEELPTAVTAAPPRASRRPRRT